MGTVPPGAPCTARSCRCTRNACSHVRRWACHWQWSSAAGACQTVAVTTGMDDESHIHTHFFVTEPYACAHRTTRSMMQQVKSELLRDWRRSRRAWSIGSGSSGRKRNPQDAGIATGTGTSASQPRRSMAPYVSGVVRSGGAARTTAKHRQSAALWHHAVHNTSCQAPRAWTAHYGWICCSTSLLHSGQCCGVKQRQSASASERTRLPAEAHAGAARGSGANLPC